MKKIVFLILYFHLLSSLFSQTRTEVYFGEPGRWDGCNNIIELYDKGYYLTGGFEGNTYDFGWNIKTDVNLEMVYDKVMKHDLSTVAPFASASDENGNIYIAGFTTYPSQWPFVSKLDSCGNKVWCKILIYDDEFNYGWANDLVLTDNDEVVLLITLVNDVQPAAQMNMTHLIGLSNNGDVLWKKPYASRYQYPWIRSPIGYHITQINNDYYISGYCYWPYPNNLNHLFLRPLFIGIDSLFNEKWILPFYALDSVFGDAFNTIAINDSVLMGVGERWLDNNDKNSIFMFYNINGENIGYKQIPDDSIAPNLIANVTRDIKRINDSLFITFSVWGTSPDAGICSEMIIDTSANIYTIHESELCTGSGTVIKTFDNNYVFSCEVKEPNSSKTDIYVYKIDENLQDVPFDSTAHNYDTLCPGGIQSGTIDLTDCFIWTNIGDAPTPQEYYASLQKIPVKAYPNPATGNEITFEYENTEYHRNMQLKCYDIFGTEVHGEKLYRYQGKSIVNVSRWQRGIYFAVVYSQGQPVGKCKFAVW